MGEKDGSRWQILASRLARRVNLGWFLQMFALPAVIAAAIGGGGILALRMIHQPIPGSLWILLVVAFVGAGVLAWRRALPRLIDSETALVRLEASLGLNNALSTARVGRGPWPEPPEESPRILQWNINRIMGPILFGLVFVLLGLLVPVSPAKAPTPENQPYTWTKLENDVEQLIEQGTIQEDYAEDLKERLKELRNQKAEEWFSASSLEATEALRNTHRNEVARLERDLQNLQQTLKQATDPSATEAKRHQMQQQLSEALEQLKNGKMKPDQDLLEKLNKAAQDAMGDLTPEEREELEKQLRQKARELAESLGEEGEPGPGEGEGEGDGEPREGDGLGEGDPSEGPGSSSDLYGENSPDLKLKRFERLDPEDDPNQDPGDLLQLEDTEHQLDLTEKGPTTSGAAQSEGIGGDRVWKDTLDPSEQKSLKRFFE